MNREALNELFDYTTFTWEVYHRAIVKLPPGEFTRPLENSGWKSILEPLVHLACAWDGWLSVHAGDEFFEFDVDSMSTWDQVQDMRTTTRGWTRRILEGTDAQLFEKAESPYSNRPDATPITEAELIKHILLHERGHHGDISTLFSQAGHPLGGSDYLVYRFFRDRKQA